MVLDRDGPNREDVVTKIDLRLREMVIDIIVNRKLRDCLDAGILVFEGLGIGIDLDVLIDLSVWPDWDTFERALPGLGEPYFFSTKATHLLWEVPIDIDRDVVLIFGRETTGLPDDLHVRYADRFVCLPIASAHVRSLNLSTTVGIALYDIVRRRMAR